MFKDKVILITGGSSGLGLGLAHYYAGQGAKLALVARNLEKLNDAKADIEAMHSSAQVQVYSIDIGDADKVEAGVKEIVSHFGRLDILINSAGILVEGYFENTSQDDFERVMHTNFSSLVNMTRQALPYLKESKGRVVNIASMASFFGTFGYTSYCASKFAVLGFSEALRTELKPQGVKVQVVCPPEFEGAMVDGIQAGRTRENRELAKTAGILSVEQVTAQTVKGIAKGKFIIVIGTTSRVLAVVNRWMPQTVRMFSDLTIKRFYVGPEKSS